MSLRRNLRRELMILAAFSAAAIAFSVALYALSPWASDTPAQRDTQAANESGQDPPTIAWEPTGQYRTEASGASLTIHKISIRPDSTVILYTLDSSVAEAVEPDSIQLLDDLSKTYRIVKDEILGSSQGVTAGVLIAEPYTGGGKVLTVTVSGLTVVSADGTASGRMDGNWTLAFVKNNEPDREPGYYSSSRVAPETVSDADLRISFNSFQGGFFRLLVDRLGTQSAIYSETSTTGTQRSVAKEEWHRLFAEVNGFPDPGSVPGWPSSEYETAD